MIVEGGKRAFNMAMGKEDAKGAAAALDKIGKYTRADKDDNNGPSLYSSPNENSILFR